MCTIMTNNRRSGFTLTEVIVVIAILGIIAAMVMTGFQNYYRYQWYSAVVNDVRNGLHESRTQTLGSIDGRVYGVYVGTSTVEFFDGTTPTPGSADNTIITFRSGTYATSSFSDSNWYVTFSRLTGTPSATGDIEIIDTLQGVTTTLSIIETGIIQ